jgi:serine-type D-Ala-D-Ala carboxypeptidase (penicillin-binding protein 5/6)
MIARSARHGETAARGEAPRPSSRRHWQVVGAVGIAALAALAVMTPAVSDHRPPPRAVPKKHAVAKPALSAYGSQPAPVAERINPRLQRGLRSGLLFDVRTGAVLWARDPGRILPIASLTKMMTALVVTDGASTNAPVLITPDAVHFSGSGVGLLPVGKRVSLKALLYGLLLVSGNDAAIALAEHVAGTQSRFIAMMNDRARRMRLPCTHFTSVSGIVDLGNHSCAVDLAIIAHAVLVRPLLAKIVASRSIILPFPIKGGKLYLYNNNPLQVLRYPGIDGVKTGFTDAAGGCLVATARRGRAWLGAVLLHSTDPADQAQRLLNAAFARLGAPAPRR